MKIEVAIDQEKSEAEMKISADAQEMTPHLQAAAKKLSSKQPLKGFRPGKAPLKVVQDALGQERVLNEALERAVPHFFVEAVVAKKIEAIDRPKVVLESAGEEGIKFSATVAILPRVQLGDLKDIKAEKKVVKVDDERLEAELTHLAKSRGKYIDVARPAQQGDTVTVDFQIFMNGELMAGGESKNHPIHLGEGHFVADFEKNLLGIQAQDKREFSINFPEDYARENLRGKKAEAKVVAHAVQKRVLPEINDEFAKELGDFNDLADLKSKLKDNLEHEMQERETERYRGELADQLAKTATFGRIPDSLIEKEIDRRIHDLEHMLAMQPAYAEASAGKQKPLEFYLSARGKTEMQLREDLKGTAEQAVKVGLVLRQFASDQEIKIGEEEIEKKMNEYLQRFDGDEEAKKKIDIQQLRENIEQMLKNEKTLEKLEELVSSE